MRLGSSIFHPRMRAISRVRVGVQYAARHINKVFSANPNPGVFDGRVELDTLAGKGRLYKKDILDASDALARCVVMVGMPYANPSDLTLQERMAYIEQVAAAPC